MAAQGYERARSARQFAARKTLALQQAAGLPDKLIRRSAVSVIVRPQVREADAAWRDAYTREALARIPGLVRQSQPDKEAGQ